MTLKVLSVVLIGAFALVALAPHASKYLGPAMGEMAAQNNALHVASDMTLAEFDAALGSLQFGQPDVKPIIGGLVASFAALKVAESHVELTMSGCGPGRLKLDFKFYNMQFPEDKAGATYCLEMQDGSMVNFENEGAVEIMVKTVTKAWKEGLLTKRLLNLVLEALEQAPIR